MLPQPSSFEVPCHRARSPVSSAGPGRWCSPPFGTRGPQGSLWRRSLPEYRCLPAGSAAFPSQSTTKCQRSLCHRGCEKSGRLQSYASSTMQLLSSLETERGPFGTTGSVRSALWTNLSPATSRLFRSPVDSSDSDRIAPIVHSPVQRIEVRRLKPRLETKILDLLAQASRLLAIPHFGSDVPDGGKKTRSHCRRQQFNLRTFSVHLQDVDAALLRLNRMQRRNDMYGIHNLNLSGIAATGCRRSVRRHQGMQTRLIPQP